MRAWRSRFKDTTAACDYTFMWTLGWRKQYAGVLTATDRWDPTFYFVDNEFYFAGGSILMGNIYEDVEKFAFFSKAALSDAVALMDVQRRT